MTRQFRFGGTNIHDESGPFIIAEIGSNHEGDLEKCLRMITMAHNCGVDAVKLQKRDNKKLFTKAAYDAPYDNENSYGPTYGIHRDFLDGFGSREFRTISDHCRRLGITWFATPFDESSVDFLLECGVPFLKFASCHVRDIPLLQHAAKYNVPMILSTGGCTETDLVRVKSNMKFMPPEKLAILHCVSTYPNQDEQLNLAHIATLRDRFPGHVIGFSSHHPGLLPNFIAWCMGARIFEVHITLNRAGKGTDNRFALEKKGLETLVEDLRRIPSMIGKGTKEFNSYECGGFINKMGRSVHPLHNIRCGEHLTLKNVGLKAPADGPPPYELHRYVGKIATVDISTATILDESMVREWRPLGDI